MHLIEREKCSEYDAIKKFNWYFPEYFYIIPQKFMQSLISQMKQTLQSRKGNSFTFAQFLQIMSPHVGTAARSFCSAKSFLLVFLFYWLNSNCFNIQYDVPLRVGRKTWSPLPWKWNYELFFSSGRDRGPFWHQTIVSDVPSITVAA